MLNNKKGITLIALVVTVVVLIILAGVSINAVLGDNGIIKKANQAASVTKEAEVKEAINRTILEFYLTNDYETLEDFLKAKAEDGSIDSVTKNADGTLTVKKGEYSVTVENKTNSSGESGSGGSTGGETQTPEITVGEIKVVANSTGTGTAITEVASVYLGNTLYITFSHAITGGTTTVNPSTPYAVTQNGTYTFTVTGTVNGKSYTKGVNVEINQFKKSILDEISIKIGDNVNYTYDTAESYLLTSTYNGYDGNQTIPQTIGLTWKVLNVDKENDTVDIISSNPTSKGVAFYGILAYNNGQYLMNEICKAQYSNKTLGVYARSINLLDMEKHLTETGIANRNAYTEAVKYGTTKTYTGSYSYYPKLYANQIGAGTNTTNVTQPDITKGNDPYEESKALVGKEPTTDNTYGNATSSGLTVTQTYYQIPINSDNYGEASNVLLNSTRYWIASRYVYTYSKGAYFGLRYAETTIGGEYMANSDKSLSKRISNSSFETICNSKL